MILEREFFLLLNNKHFRSKKWIKKLKQEEAVYFLLVNDFGLLGVFLLACRLFKARTGLPIFISDNAWEMFVFCFDKRSVARWGLFIWCCRWFWGGNWPDVCMNVCLNSAIVNIITRKPDGGNPSISESHMLSMETCSNWSKHNNV